MKAYLIDPTTFSITEITIGEHYTEISKAIGCDHFDLVRLDGEGNAIYVDDEGLLNGKFDEEGGFIVGAPHASNGMHLAGKGVLLGCDATGKSTSPTLSIEDFKRLYFRGWLVPKAKVNTYKYVVTVTTDSREHADEVMGERLGPDEDYGFEYYLDMKPLN